jgi:hypothetical protein
LEINQLDSGILNKDPIDEDRSDCAYLLSNFLYHFVFYHELGHVRQLTHSSSPQQLYIEHRSATDNHEKWDQQATEVDADVFAVNYFLMDVSRLIENIRADNLNDTGSDVVILAYYAMLLFFYISNTSKEINDPTKGHPHPMVRLTYVANFFSAIHAALHLVMSEQILFDSHLCHTRNEKTPGTNPGSNENNK